jgi:formate hydrogenlyase subunit 4
LIVATNVVVSLVIVTDDEAVERFPTGSIAYAWKTFVPVFKFTEIENVVVDNQLATGVAPLYIVIIAQLSAVPVSNILEAATVDEGVEITGALGAILSTNTELAFVVVVCVVPVFPYISE